MTGYEIEIRKLNNQEWRSLHKYGKKSWASSSKRVLYAGGG